MFSFLWDSAISAIRLFRGGNAFVQLYLGAVLGLTLGLLPAANLLFLFALAALILLNINGVLAAAGYALGAAILAVFGHELLQLSAWLGANTAINSHVNTMSNVPVLALFGFDAPLQRGIIPVWLLGLLALWPLCGWLVRAQKSNETSGAVAWVIRRITNTQRGIKGAYTSTSLITISRLFAAALLLPVSALIAHNAAERQLQWHVEDYVSESSDYRLNIGGVSLSLLQGEIDLQNVIISHKDDAEKYLFWASKMEADIDTAALLTKQLVVSELRAKTGWIDYPLTDDARAEQLQKAREAIVGGAQVNTLSPEDYAVYAANINARLNAAMDQFVAHPTNPLPWHIDHIYLYHLNYLPTVPQIDIALYQLHDGFADARMQASMNEESFYRLKKNSLRQMDRTREEEFGFDQIQAKGEALIEGWIKNTFGLDKK